MQSLFLNRFINIFLYFLFLFSNPSRVNFYFQGKFCLAFIIITKMLIVIVKQAVKPHTGFELRNGLGIRNGLGDDTTTTKKRDSISGCQLCK